MLHFRPSIGIWWEPIGTFRRESIYLGLLLFLRDFIASTTATSLRLASSWRAMYGRITFFMTWRRLIIVLKFSLCLSIQLREEKVSLYWLKTKSLFSSWLVVGEPLSLSSSGIPYLLYFKKKILYTSLEGLRAHHSLNFFFWDGYMQSPPLSLISLLEVEL